MANQSSTPMVLDMRRKGFLPRLSVAPVLRSSAIDAETNRLRQKFWASQQDTPTWEVDQAGVVSAVPAPAVPEVLCTMADVLQHATRGVRVCEVCGWGVPEIMVWNEPCPHCLRPMYHRPRREPLGVYESGGPTCAKPGRQWLTRAPLPWESNPYIRYRQWERPIYLCEVSPVEWPPGWGYITARWKLRIEGDAEVFAALGEFWRGRPERCARCKARGMNCPHTLRRRRLLPGWRWSRGIDFAERASMYITWRDSSLDSVVVADGGADV